MMEILVRMAEEKYVLKYKSTNNHFEAVQNFWEEHLAQQINNQYNLQIWRTERYWNEECDTHAQSIIRELQSTYIKSIQRQKQNMGISEEAHFGPNVAFQAFNFLTMTQVNELQSDRTFYMSQVEFYEALARIAEAASLESIQGIHFINLNFMIEKQTQLIFQVDEEWNIEKRKNQILAYKLKAFLVKMLQDYM